MQHKVYEIFPTLVMKFNLERDFSNDEISFIHDTKTKVYKNYGNYSSTNTFILNEPQMSELKKFCESSLEFYFEEFYKPLTKVKSTITQSWLNYTENNQHHHGHTHPNSLISGVFYISANKDSDRICFCRNDYKQISIAEREKNDYNTDEIEFKVNSGELLLFPSNLIHKVPLKNDKDLRISLAFNSFITGEIVFLRSLNYLKL
jgi:uncharacterized protein (TIGR02466 family)